VPLPSRLEMDESFLSANIAQNKARRATRRRWLLLYFSIICKISIRDGTVRTTKGTSNRESISVLSLSVPVMFPEIQYCITVKTNDDTGPAPFSSSQIVSKVTFLT
jgi:hypothetical protein